MLLREADVEHGSPSEAKWTRGTSAARTFFYSSVERRLFGFEESNFAQCASELHVLSNVKEEGLSIVGLQVTKAYAPRTMPHTSGSCIRS